MLMLGKRMLHLKVVNFIGQVNKKLAKLAFLYWGEFVEESNSKDKSVKNNLVLGEYF